MRSLSLSKNGTNRYKSQHLELKNTDFEDSLKSLSPGEWCAIKLDQSDYAVAFINPLVDEKYSCAYIISKITSDELNNFKPEILIKEKLILAFNKRKKISGYEKNARMFYGVNDGLPGLIIDQFQNAVIVQINTAGVDRYRDFIQEEVKKITNVSTYFLDNQKYREKESLPSFNSEPVPDLLVSENNLNYKIRAEVVQKVGFYYDHRENRYQLINFISRLKSKPKIGVDLFCYAGAWGMSGLKAGVEKMHFVDQGDFSTEVSENLKLNGYEGQGEFYRHDVFKFLDESIKQDIKYDLVLCDPPAFAKSPLQKNQALEGYSKLHKKVFKALEKDSIVSFSSCTHYVDHEEFQKNIFEAASKENRKIQMVYSGMQGFDHPVGTMDDKSNYIKSYFYLVE